MTILSDRQIIIRNTVPTGRAFLYGLWHDVFHIDNKWFDINGNEYLHSDFNDFKPYEYTDLAIRNFKPMIQSFVDHQVKTIRKFRTIDTLLSTKHHNYTPEELEKLTDEHKIISYGLSSYGYDLRVGHKFKIFHNALSSIIDPKNFDEKSFIDFEGDVCIIPPNSFVLAASYERIAMPRDVAAIVLGKSTYARCGISCLATPLEPEWEGFVTLEFANTTPLPAKLYADEGACQVIFHKGQTCDVSYADRAGKYMNQESGPVVPRV